MNMNDFMSTINWLGQVNKDDYQPYLYDVDAEHLFDQSQNERSTGSPI